MSVMIGEDAVGVFFPVLVQPRASRAKVGPVHDGRIKLAVTAPPVDGDANAAVIELVAKTFGIAKTRVSITSGERSKRKVVRIEGMKQLAFAKLLDEVLA